MHLVNDGDPALLKAMGVDGVVLGCAPGVYGEELDTVITPENVSRFGRKAQEARVRQCWAIARFRVQDFQLTSEAEF